MTEQSSQKSLDEYINELKSDFPNKGKYIVYDRSWNKTGYSDTAVSKGQLPVRFPEHWSPFMCHYLRNYIDVPLI